MTKPAVTQMKEQPERTPKPPWLRVKAPNSAEYHSTRKLMRKHKLNTVCEEAACPNIGECWDGGTATIMLMGDVCTRGCRFCAVTTGKPSALDRNEPTHAARAVAAMGVNYIVMTSVNRDDLPDGGAAHFAETVTKLRELAPEIMSEVLVPDFQGDVASVAKLIDAGPEVIAHNVETVRRLSRRVRDARATFDRSLAVLEYVKREGRGKGPRGTDILAKTSIMCGLSETEDEVIEAMKELRAIDVDVITFGQYLQPSPKHLDVVAFITPEQFDRYAEIARELGFLYVASGPLVRSSYRAGEFYLHAHLEAAQRAARGGAS